MSTKQQVSFDDFTERHYIKKFVKKYSTRAWGATEIAIRAICMNVDVSLATEKLETISQKNDKLLCKLYFSVAGSNRSPKGSGNRCIVAVDTHNARVSVLLVYHKNDLTGSGSETDKWKSVIKNNYSQYNDLI